VAPALPELEHAFDMLVKERLVVTADRVDGKLARPHLILRRQMPL
jgi:hypothetical protein